MSEQHGQDNVVPLRTVKSSGGNGGGDDIRERLARLEEKVGHLASKEDVQKIKVWVLVGIIGAVPTLVIMLLAATRFLKLQ